ncbi:hypothetical protein KC973_00520 [Candidatus Saccharibacteria bacterium]|nr:hypothetical protein [Candidatus Saccharibacteria bacterium]
MTSKQSDMGGHDDLDEALLKDVHIADEDLEVDDKHSKHAKKKAKKLSKSQLSDTDRKRIKRKKVLIIGGIFLAIVITLLAVPFTRWPILNALGLRSSIQFTVVEKTDKLPLNSASILLDDEYFTTTNEFGQAEFENVRLGQHTLSVRKNGYSREDISITSGLTTSAHKIELISIGVKVNLDIRNWLTGDSIAGAKISLGEDAAVSDKTGRASIVVPPDSEDKVQLAVAADGYLTQTVPIRVGVESKEVSLVSNAKNYFISNRDGKYDIFSSNIDGTGQQKAIEATGKEDPDLLQFSVHRGNRFAVLVANRDGRVTNNRVVAGVYIVDFASNTLKKIDDGSDVRLFDWGDDAIVYQMTNPDLNYDDPALTQLISFNVVTGRKSQVAQANYFSAALVAQNTVFYARADGYREDANSPLTSLELSKGTSRTYLDGIIPSYLTRANYDQLTLYGTNSQYYSINAGSGSTRTIDRRVDNDLHYGLNPNGAEVVWAETRDGQGTLLSRSTKQDNTRTVTKLSGLTSPVRFVTDRLAVVRVVTTTETADYLVDVPTTKTSKIVDVSNIRFVGTIL